MSKRPWEVTFETVRLQSGGVAATTGREKQTHRLGSTRGNLLKAQCNTCELYLAFNETPWGVAPAACLKRWAQTKVGSENILNPGTIRFSTRTEVHTQILSHTLIFHLPNLRDPRTGYCCPTLLSQLLKPRGSGSLGRLLQSAWRKTIHEYQEIPLYLLPDPYENTSRRSSFGGNPTYVHS